MQSRTDAALQSLRISSSEECLGGLTHLLVPESTNEGQWKTLYQPEEIETAMHTQCQNHFQQAHGSSYTVPPLTDLLGTDSLTKFGEQLLQGTANLDVLQVSMHTKLLLNQHGRKYPKYKSTHLPLRFEELMQGIWKWLERMSTSPSGCHLGTYKSLLKDFPPPKQKHKPNKQTKQPVDNAQPYRINVMEAIFQMLCMAIKHTHTFD